MQLSNIQLSGEYITYLQDGEPRTIPFQHFTEWAREKSHQPNVFNHMSQGTRAWLLRFYLRDNPKTAETGLICFEYYDAAGIPCGEWVTPEKWVEHTRNQEAYYASEAIKEEMAGRHTEYSYRATFHSSHA
jgi:hypothetical protein